MKDKFSIPDEVQKIRAQLEEAGFEAYLVGGCVRDILLERIPKDWDVATNARPEQIIDIFPDSIYENEFGTVLVKIRENISSVDPGPESGMTYFSSLIRTVEITTYRIEGKYTDKRHPDEVKFAKTIEEDLSRRDFTINAIAMKIESLKPKVESALVDPFDGQIDLKKKIIRTVGKPEERFTEDALRLMRAVRFACQLSGPDGDFTIEPETQAAIKKLARHLEIIAKERIRDELSKILMTPEARPENSSMEQSPRSLGSFSVANPDSLRGIREYPLSGDRASHSKNPPNDRGPIFGMSSAAKGIVLLEELGLLKYVLPELRESINVGQNLHHIYNVFEHSVRALDYAAKQNYELPIRMAALLHDIGKPRSKQGDGYNSTFYQHEYIGAKMALKALDRLRFPRDFVEKVTHLVRRHMFYYNVGEISPAGVRRFVARVGPENIDDLLKVREADRIGSGVAKAIPYKLRHLLFMIDKVKRDPLTPRMLKINGDDLMAQLGLPQGLRVGWILHALLEEVIEDPEKNIKKYLTKRADELNKLSDDELREIMASARQKEKEAEEEMDQAIKEKHKVQ